MICFCGLSGFILPPFLEYGDVALRLGPYMSISNKNAICTRTEKARKCSKSQQTTHHGSHSWLQNRVVEPDVIRGLQPAGATRVTLDVIIPSPTGRPGPAVSCLYLRGSFLAVVCLYFLFFVLTVLFFCRRPLSFGGSPLEAYPRTSGETNHLRSDGFVLTFFVVRLSGTCPGWAVRY